MSVQSEITRITNEVIAQKSLISQIATALGCEVNTSNIANNTTSLQKILFAVKCLVLGYTNQIPISTDTNGSVYNNVGYRPNYYLSSSSGAPSGKSGYNVTGFIPIGYGSSQSAVGEQVIRLKNIEALPTDSSVRVAYYDANKTFIGLVAASNMVTTHTASKVNYALDENGYINYIDVSANTGYLVHTSGKAAICYFRICAPGIDGDSIITVNEEMS